MLRKITIYGHFPISFVNSHGKKVWDHNMIVLYISKSVLLREDTVSYLLKVRIFKYVNQANTSSKWVKKS